MPLATLYTWQDPAAWTLAAVLLYCSYRLARRAPKRGCAKCPALDRRF